MGSVAILTPQAVANSPHQLIPEERFSERIARFLQRIDYRIADSEVQREAIFRQRYQAYLRDGIIAPNMTGMFSDEEDEDDNVYLIGVYFEGMLAGSLRMHIGSREHPHFPSLEVFPDVMEPELEAGRTVIDSTRFVADANLSRLYRGLPYAIVRIGWMAAEHFHADHLLAAVRLEHHAFYRRVFGHTIICEARPYPRLAKPIGLMTVNQAEVADQVYRRYPFFRSTLFERRMLFERRPKAAVLRPVPSIPARELAGSR